jgi:hypothetical protein
MIRLYFKSLQDLVQHLAMLSGDAHFDVEFVGMFAQAANYRAELDRLRPGTEDQQDLVHQQAAE